MNSTLLPLPNPLPLSLKPLGHFLKLATEHESRDPVISYWCRLAALQSGMKLDRKSKESLSVLTPLMDWLENEKRVLSNNEAITSDIVAAAYLENYAVKLFSYADHEDRASRFNKNVIKAFYTSGTLFDVISVVFKDELSVENVHMRKYAKWKAAYIHTCMKSGQVPVPGPKTDDDNDDNNDDNDDEATAAAAEAKNTTHLPSSSINKMEPTIEIKRESKELLDPNVVIRAQKYCKYATNALDFEDKGSAIENLRKALSLLETGQEE